MVDLGPCRRKGSVFRCFLSFIRICAILKKTRRQRLLEDEIRSSPSSPRSSDVSNIIGRHVEVCLRRTSWDPVGVCLGWIRLDLVFVRLRMCVFKLDPSDLCFSLSAVIAVLVHWSYGALHDDFLTVYYNNVCSTPMREGR